MKTVFIYFSYLYVMPLSIYTLVFLSVLLAVLFCIFYLKYTISKIFFFFQLLPLRVTTADCLPPSHPIHSIFFSHTNPPHVILHYIHDSSLRSFSFPSVCPSQPCLSVSPNKSIWAFTLMHSKLILSKSQQKSCHLQHCHSATPPPVFFQCLFMLYAIL